MIVEKVGNRIKELRHQSGLSQEKFSLFIGMDRSYFASVESGKRNVSIINLDKIIKGFGISLECFFKNIGEDE